MINIFIELINSLIKIIESRECFVVVCALGAGLGVYYYKHPDNDQVLCSLVTLSVVLVFCVFFYIKNKIVCCRYVKQKEIEYNSQRQFNENRKMGVAIDVYNQLSEFDRNILFYAVLNGRRSKEKKTKFYYKQDKYNLFLNRLSEKCSIDYFNPLVEYIVTGDCNSFSLDFNPYLLNYTEEEIDKNGITKSQLESYFDTFCSNR